MIKKPPRRPKIAAKPKMFYAWALGIMFSFLMPVCVCMSMCTYVYVWTRVSGMVSLDLVMGEK